MEEQILKVGDIVSLKSSTSSSYTIGAIIDDKAECFFDKNGEPFSKKIPLSALQIAEGPIKIYLPDNGRQS